MTSTCPQSFKMKLVWQREQTLALIIFRRTKVIDLEMSPAPTGRRGQDPEGTTEDRRCLAHWWMYDRHQDSDKRDTELCVTCVALDRRDADKQKQRPTLEEKETKNEFWTSENSFDFWTCPRSKRITKWTGRLQDQDQSTKKSTARDRDKFKMWKRTTISLRWSVFCLTLMCFPFVPRLILLFLILPWLSPSTFVIRVVRNHFSSNWQKSSLWKLVYKVRKKKAKTYCNKRKDIL